MEARLVLLSQVRALLQDLAIAEKALTAPSIRQDLRDRVGSLFAGLINNKKLDLEKVIDASGGPSLQDCWDAFGKHSKDCDRVFKEYLAFLEGALIRSAELDEGLCDVADELLEQLSQWTDIDWPRLTIMAEGEFFANLTEIIRLRYPPFSIWNLPVLAHEFGHFIAPKVKDRLTGAEPLKGLHKEIRSELAVQLQTLPEQRREAEIKRTLTYLDEFWADVFATYSLGPAYACTCILLRFNPGKPYSETAEYPSDDQRTYALLRTLDELDPKYRKVARLLRSTWQDSLVAAGRSQSHIANAETSKWLDGIADRMYVILQRLPPEARFKGWSGAYELSKRLRSHNWKPEVEANTLTLRDVLNGAWLCRLDYGEEGVKLISDRALELCRGMVRRKEPGRAAVTR